MVTVPLIVFVNGGPRELEFNSASRPWMSMEGSLEIFSPIQAGLIEAARDLPSAVCFFLPLYCSSSGLNPTEPGSWECREGRPTAKPLPAPRPNSCPSRSAITRAGILATRRSCAALAIRPPPARSAAHVREPDARTAPQPPAHNQPALRAPGQRSERT